MWIHAFLTSALDGGEWSASCPGRFSPRERAHVTNWIGGPRTVLEAAAYLCPAGDRVPVLRAVAHSLY